MFENALLEGKARTRRGWTVIVSSGLQTCGIGIALLIPLLNPELLPATLQAKVWLAPPPPGPPPTPETPATPRQTTKAPTQRTSTGVLAYTRIPPKPAVIIDEPTDLGPVGPYVPGSIEGGIGRGGPQSDLMRAFTTTAAPPPPPPQTKKPEPKSDAIIQVRRGGDVQEAMLIHRVIPPYPPLARTARIEGKVQFTAVIGRDGVIKNLQLVNGHALLIPAAKDAVIQWRYRPTLLNGEAVEVLTTIEVNFTLNK